MWTGDIWYLNSWFLQQICFACFEDETLLTYKNLSVSIFCSFQCLCIHLMCEIPKISLNLVTGMTVDVKAAVIMFVAVFEIDNQGDTVKMFFL